MRKIATLFDRDWEGRRGVVPQWSADAARVLQGPTDALYPTEKLDGTNVRLTLRAGAVVRVEKRRNPSKEQKAAGISEPWYADASDGPEDLYVVEAARSVPWSDSDLSQPPDGEWPGEAVGEKIQGNPLGLTGRMVVLFSLGQAPELDDAPSISDGLRLGPVAIFEPLREYLLAKRSALNPERPIEGIVWQNAYGDHLKLKARDFK